jgi:hypothetical protein
MAISRLCHDHVYRSRKYWAHFQSLGGTCTALRYVAPLFLRVLSNDVCHPSSPHMNVCGAGWVRVVDRVAVIYLPIASVPRFPLQVIANESCLRSLSLELSMLPLFLSHGVRPPPPPQTCGARPRVCWVLQCDRVPVGSGHAFVAIPVHRLWSGLVWSSRLDSSAGDQ